MSKSRTEPLPIEIDLTFGDIVYHKTTSEHKGIVTGLLMRPSSTLYAVTWDDLEEKFHSACELTTEKDFQT